MKIRHWLNPHQKYCQKLGSSGLLLQTIRGFVNAQKLILLRTSLTKREAHLLSTTRFVPSNRANRLSAKDGRCADKQAGDKIITREGVMVELAETKFSYEPEQVHKFEIAAWHTYVVGVRAWLVHNAKKCASDIVEKLKRTKCVDNRRIARQKYPTKSS